MIDSKVWIVYIRGRWVYSFVPLVSLNFWESEQSYKFSIHLELTEIAYRHLIDELLER